MPGRPRNADRQAIEAFARIHQGRAGSADGVRTASGYTYGSEPSRYKANRDSGTANGGRSPVGVATQVDEPGPDAARSAPLYVPTEAAYGGYLPPLPNLERPRIGRRVAIAGIATIVVVLIALGIAGATAGHHSGSHLTASRTATSVGSGSGRASGSGHPAGRTGSGGQSGHGSGTRAPASASATGPISPTTTSSSSVQFQLAAASAPFTVTIEAVQGSCWAEAAPSSSATLTWAGTVIQGTRHVLSAGSTWWLRLGAPEFVTVTVNGRALRLPTTSSPLDVGISSA